MSGYDERMARFAVVGFAVLAVACSSGAQTTSSGPQLLTSHQDLCAGAAPETVDHLVTAESCPFIQHADNISKYGEALNENQQLLDATGKVLATVTNTCDTWTLGTDANGVVVLIDRSNGMIVSHGLLHAGQPISTLVSPAAMPLTLK